jgi:hypothetical protein
MKAICTAAASSRFPRVGILEKLFDIVYFTSLKTEEGRPIVARLCLVNPEKPDDSPPPRPRLSRWVTVQLANRLPLTVPNLVKIAKAADPWSSAVAVYYDRAGALFIWGLIDQTVHWNRMLVREGSGYAPPGIINVVATGIADISVYRRWGFIGRLRQDDLIRNQNDVFWSGPVAERLREWMRPFLNRIRRQVGAGLYDSQIWDGMFRELWIGTLCRTLISIQRYRHGGAILIARSDNDLFPHYQIAYDRLPRHLLRIAIERAGKSEKSDQIIELIDDSDQQFVPIQDYLDERIGEAEIQDLEDSLTGAVHFISSLSCIDGLVLMRPDLSVRGYGVEIRTRKELDVIRLSYSPTLRVKTSRIVETINYGTRHRSMMRYCFSHPSSLGFVISQDGDIRAVMRVGEELVMWDNLKVHLLWSEDWDKAIQKVKRTAGKTADSK